MTYRGHVEDGAIVLDEPLDLPNGAVVRIEVAGVGQSMDPKSVRSLAESLAGVIGKAEGVPTDWSENHDGYLRQEHAQ